MLKNIKSILSLTLCLVLAFLTACTGNKNTETAIIKVYEAQSQTVVKLPQTPRFQKLLDSNGKINVELLDSVNVSSISKNYDDRIYIKYNGQPFFYNPVYISYDQILNSRVIADNRKTAVLENTFAKAKECGFKTVALFVDWKYFYNGTNYDFDFYKIYYKLAEKYDLNVSIVWNGYIKNGYMPWQTDRTKYPALVTNKKIDVPDLSQEIYINEAVEAITQFCAWLNYIDYGRRTVLIQLEDEANANYGKGAWLSQYGNYSNLVLKMADAVKKSPFNVITTVGINFDDYRTTIEGVTGRDRLDKFLNYENIDGMGAADLSTNEFDVGIFANDDKFCYVSKISPAIYGFFADSLKLLSKGYQFGVYELKSFDLAVNCGMYRTHSTIWEVRNKQTVDRGILAKRRTMEAATADVVDYIKGINNIGRLLAVTNTLDIVIINPFALNNYAITSMVGDVKISYNNISNPNFTYNSAVICVVDAYSNYYATSFHGTPFFAINYSDSIIINEGKLVNGEWVSDTKDITLEDRYILMKSGVVYKFVLN